MKVAVAAAALVSGVVLLVGCSASEAGTPRPAGSEGAPASSGPEEPATIDDLEPCDLMAADELAEIGLEDGVRRSDLACDWTVDSRTGVRADLSPAIGIDEVPDPGSPVSIGAHDAYRLEAPDGQRGACGVFLVVSEEAYVVVTATSGTDTAGACDLATTVAEYIEPRLP